MLMTVIMMILVVAYGRNWHNDDYTMTTNDNANKLVHNIIHNRDNQSAKHQKEQHLSHFYNFYEQGW